MTLSSALTSLQPDSILSYVIAIVIPALDAIFPVLPSETAVIALGVATAGSTDPRIALLVAFAALGAFLGDNLCYLIGRRFGPRVERRFFSSARGARQRAWAERSLDRYGTQLIIVCRFIPGGRTAVTLCCGLIGYSRRRYVPATAVAAVAWATYSFFIGRLGGRAFEDNMWAGLLLSVGITLVISALVEAFRRIRRRSAGQPPAAPGGPTEPDGARPAEPGDDAPRHYSNTSTDLSALLSIWMDASPFLIVIGYRRQRARDKSGRAIFRNTLGGGLCAALATTAGPGSGPVPVRGRGSGAQQAGRVGDFSPAG